LVFGFVRRKWLSLTPEELIRQSLLHYLISDRGFSKKRIAVEKEIPFFDSYKRFDILYYNTQAAPVLMVECKSHKHKITQKVLDQIAIYNQIMKVPFLLVCNGIQTVCLKFDKDKSDYISLAYVPDSEELHSYII
jgi:hypothetical protein